MKFENLIGWCDETTNAVTGCDKVSAGCKNCYAAVGTRARVLRAQGIETWGPRGVRHPVNFEPVFRRLNKLCVCDKCHASHELPTFFPGTKCANFAFGDSPCGGILRRIRLFADSNSDFLDERWPVETLARFLDAIRLASNVDVILLTKRPENFMNRLEKTYDWFGKDWDFYANSSVWTDEWVLDNRPPSHIWLGVSVENQAMADKRIPELLKIPAAVRFLSVEPLLENVNLGLVKEQIDWVIVGGESGPNRRDCGVEAIVSVAEQCEAAGVPCYVKQDADFKSGQQGRIPDDYWKLKQFPNL